MEAYLDNSATTRCTEAVREVVVRTMMEDYGNPSSKHMKGVEAERYLREARAYCRLYWGGRKRNIFYFWSHGVQ